ncbi:MAG TPA: ABC transporter ATP-binding protein [Candidatus Eisenbacteria bacterium]|nr:ABC transporter ATP-binding protein [Candidatus Eisenbacteria bacterium]
MTMPAILEVRGACKRFGGAIALDGVDLDVQRGEWVGLLGPNGAGKTTLVRAIAGRVRLDAGSIALAGGPSDRTALGHRVGLAPQENALYPFLTARENLEVFGRLYGLDGPELGERVAWALGWTGLAERADERTGGFSGGMKRRLNLACAVLHRPGLVLLDEPTTGVDPQSRERIFAMLAELRRDGTALLHTTHQLGEAQGVCERVVIIDHGRVVAAGAPLELVERTLGHAQEVVVTLDRAPVPASLPTGVDAQGRMLRVSMHDLTVDLAMLLGRLREAGYGVDDVRVVRPDLQAVFLHLTGRELRE